MAQPEGSPARWFLGAGAALLAMAGFFLWRDLALLPEYVLSVAAVIATGLAFARRRAIGTAGVVALLGCVVGGGAWYAATRADALLPGLGLGLVGALMAAIATLGRAEAERDLLRVRVLWSALTAGALGASWAIYFRLLTLGFAEHLERRLVLTLAWLVTGLVLAVTHQKRAGDPARWAGYAFVIAALGKVVGYDTTHLSGTLRVAVLAAAGGLLLVGGWLSSRAHATRVAAAPDDGALA